MNLMTDSPVPDHFDLDPGRMPLRVDLELSDKIRRKLELICAATGRSMDEVILEILANSVDNI